MAVTKVAKKRRIVPLRDLSEIVKGYVSAKIAAANMSEQQGRMRDRLIEIFEHDGEEDEKGNLFLDLPEHVQDSKGRLVDRIKLQLNTRESLRDDAEVEKILNRLGVLDQCQTTIVVLDEQKILSLHAAGDISEKDLASMYTEKSHWSLPQL